MRATDKLGGPFTPPGFYYKTFIRPRRFWPLYEVVDGRYRLSYRPQQAPVEESSAPQAAPARDE